MKDKENADTDVIDDEISEEKDEPIKKKAKIFSIKEFRKNLKGEHILKALQSFHDLCSVKQKGHDYILEYLQGGGSCLELLQLMEVHTDTCQLVLEIVYIILLEINSKYPQYTVNAHDACKYFLSTYMTMTNKMLSLNSTRPERIAILKLLTAVVALSPNFAKDILIHVNINVKNIGFLTNSGYSKDAVRSAFINFLMAFLVDGYYPTLSALLEKRGLLTSIIKGLTHDDADVVCVVMDTLRNHILENPLVSKTVKMWTFSTPVIKDVVQLYNWKGPAPIQKNSKKKKESVAAPDVDPQLKLKVSNCVHEFLLILCTSHKYGVVFRDAQMGLGRKTQNSLVYTVLDSLDTPWKHSYASELVIKICGACPDLTKTIWIQLKESLEPRRTEQWLSALRFTEKLFEELTPDRITYCMKDFTPHQLAQITQMLIAPTSILKSLIDLASFTDKYLKYHIVKVLLKSINLIELYLNFANKMITAENYKLYKKLVTEHVERNFPNSTLLLQNYTEKDGGINDYDFLDEIFCLLSKYQTVCPRLLDFTATPIDFKDILDYAKEISGDNPGILEMKIVKLYLDHDPVAFLPNTELLEQVLPFVLDCYCRLHDETSFEVLQKIFLNTGALQSYETEVKIWITSLRNVDKCSDSIVELFGRILKLVFEKSMLYFAELSEVKANLPGLVKETVDLNEVMENFSNEDDIKIVLKRSIIRHVYLSPIILSVLECLETVEKSKLLKSYLQYAFLNVLHLQTDPSLFLAIIEKYDCKFLNSNLLKYVVSWGEADSDKILSYTKGKIELLSKFSHVLIQSDLNTFLSENVIDCEDDILNLFHMSCFFISNFARNKKLDQKLVENCIVYVKFCITKEININILNHPVFLHYFTPLDIEKDGSTNALITDFVINVIKEMPQSTDVLEQYRNKLFNSVKRMFNKASKYKNYQSNSFMNIVTALNLNIEQCFELCNHISDLKVKNLINDEQNLSIFVPIMTFLINYLNQLGKSCEYVLEKNIIEAISNDISFLITKNENFDITTYIKSVTTYLETFPHCLEYIPKELFVSITQKLEYNKECVELLILILESKFDELLSDLVLNIDNITTKKGVILPILDVIQNFNVSEENLRIIYDKIEPLLLKTIQKPQKAGQHFEKHHTGIAYLLNKFFTFEKYKNFIEKIHKYDTTDLFHVNILKIIFKKAINKNEQYIKNSILTFVHLTMNFFKKKTKTEEDWVKFIDVIATIRDICNDIPEDSNASCDYTQILQNETFKTFCKFCLKFGLSGYEQLLSILTVLVRKLPFSVDDSQLLLEMTVSHSEFLDWVLNEDSNCKTEILNLMHELFEKSQELMAKQYLPILLAAYRAMLKRSDRIIFKILRMFEAYPSQTNFYDFNPFLWGKSAANHYSVRSDVQKALWRQPRTGTVLDILEMHLVLNTINKYPLNLPLNGISLELCPTMGDPDNIYDLTFLIPLFTLLLAPENAVQTYRFTKSGALSLTISALSSQDEETRNGACFVLSRFYHHIEARQSGKDNQLWLRFIEAICKGMATMEDLKLNKFASTFLARMALVLTQPTHVMYVPLSQYLSAKSTLDFTMIPELYTLLHSPDVNFKEHRNFILEVLRDGLVSDEDFHIALRSVSFKLIMEQYTSVVTDIDAKILILQVIERATSLKEGSKFLCSNYGLLSWLYNVVIELDKTNQKQFLICLTIILNIISCKDNIDLFIIVFLISQVIDNISKYSMTNDVLLILLKILCLLFQISNEWLSEDRLKILIKAVNCKECEYVLKYGSKYFKFDVDNLILERTDSNYYILFLTLSWLKKKS